VPELRAERVGVILCSADAAALDALGAPPRASTKMRTAVDETIIAAAPDMVDDVVTELRVRISALDDDALVLDVSDGWAAWSITGEDAARAFSYLSALDPPSGTDFVQGDVARVAAKVLASDDGLTILVPAYWSEHLRRRAVVDARATEVAT
jgi:hypothetical protein